MWASKAAGQRQAWKRVLLLLNGISKALLELVQVKSIMNRRNTDRLTGIVGFS